MTEDEMVSRLAVGLLARVQMYMHQYDLLQIEDPSIRRSYPADNEYATHYTSERVAKLILSTNQVWLMDATTSNDRFERSHGIRVIWDTLAEAWRFTFKEAEATEAFFEADESQPRRIEKMGMSLRSGLLKDDGSVGLVFCVCTQESDQLESGDLGAFDNLPMWREYGAGGGGVALRINTSTLASPMRSMGCQFFNVYYRLQEKERACRFLVIASLELMRGRRHWSSWIKYLAGIHMGTQVSREQSMRASMQAVNMLSFLFKDPSYAYEKERRQLCCRPQGATEAFKDPSTGISRRYLTSQALGFKGELPISEVCIGPRAHSKTEAEIVEVAKCRGIPVRKSMLPYRGSDIDRFDFDELREKLRSQELAACSTDEPTRLGQLKTARKRRDRHWRGLLRAAPERDL